MRSPAWKSPGRRAAPTIATVDSSGLVTAAGNGEAVVTAAAGQVNATATVSVRQSAASAVISPERLDLDALGDTVRISVTIRDARGNAVPGLEVAWSSSDTTVATVGCCRARNLRRKRPGRCHGQVRGDRGERSGVRPPVCRVDRHLAGPAELRGAGGHRAALGHGERRPRPRGARCRSGMVGERPHRSHRRRDRTRDRHREGRGDRYRNLRRSERKPFPSPFANPRARSGASMAGPTTTPARAWTFWLTSPRRDSGPAGPPAT